MAPTTGRTTAPITAATTVRTGRRSASASTSGIPGHYGAYPYCYGHPYAYGGYPSYGSYGGYAGAPYGGVRIQIARRAAEVYVGGYFAGTVDDFDGSLQQLNLEPGPHRIEVRENGFEPMAFDVYVQPGRTTTYRTAMRPVQP